MNYAVLFSREFVLAVGIGKKEMHELILCYGNIGFNSYWSFRKTPAYF